MSQVFFFTISATFLAEIVTPFQTITLFLSRHFFLYFHLEISLRLNKFFNKCLINPQWNKTFEWKNVSCCIAVDDKSTQHGNVHGDLKEFYAFGSNMDRRKKGVRISATLILNSLCRFKLLSNSDRLWAPSRKYLQENWHKLP